jgi:hypothetical protein
MVVVLRNKSEEADSLAEQVRIKSEELSTKSQEYDVAAAHLPIKCE